MDSTVVVLIENIAKQIAYVFYGLGLLAASLVMLYMKLNKTSKQIKEVTDERA